MSNIIEKTLGQMIEPGMKFGKLLVVSKTNKKDSTGSYYWECLCDCGEKVSVLSYQLRGNKSSRRRTTSCGCSRWLDLKGKVFGKWEVLSMSHIKNQCTYWLCRCSCGYETTVRSSSLVSGDSSRCKKCATTENGIKNRKPDFFVASNLLYRQYKSGAKRRGYTFNLKKEDFDKLITQNCYYCGIRPSNVFTGFQRKNEHNHTPVMYSGIDRVDNTLGYSKENCVPCCARCNYAKSNITQKQFYSWIRDVYINHISGASEKTIGMLTDELGTVLIKCFMAQEDIMNPNLSAEKQTLAAHRAQELNARRNEIIRTIDMVAGVIKDSPTEKTYHTYFENSYDKELKT